MPTDQPRFVRQKNAEPRIELKAAQYLRASTDHQKFSIENQQQVIAQYAAFRGIEIVRTYTDPARTGVTMRKRAGLKRLISDVQNGHPGFNIILVYDVSRWGRFQDTDESAHYEFLCKSGGISIHYCAELFKNDGALINNVIKNMKRAMAGEYSRDLSARVIQGHRRLAGLGFHQGGVPNFGFRRLMVDEKGKPRGQLSTGQHKYLATDRVVLVPGPQEEIAVVREIFMLFVEKHLPKKRIAKMLNERGIRNGRGNCWTGQNIDQLLRCERYIGNLVYNRSSVKLGADRIVLPHDQWIRVQGAFKPLVDLKLFLSAQRILDNTWPATDNDLLDYLTATLCKNGFLSAKIIDRSILMPSTNTYFEHFGSLSNAYRLIGYKPAHRYRFRGLSDLLRRLDQRITGQIIADITRIGGETILDNETHVLTIDGHLDVAVVLVPYLDRMPQIAGWKLILNQVQHCHTILLTRLNKTNTEVLDYHLLPRCIFLKPSFRFTRHNIEQFSYYKIEILSDLYRTYKRNYFGEPGQRPGVVLPVDKHRPTQSPYH